MPGIEFAPPGPEIQPFNVTPPQSPNPLETLARMQALKGQQLQQQGQVIQQQGMQQENQQRQIEMQDQQLMRQAYMQSGGDLDKTLQKATELGVSPKTGLALQQQIMTMKATKAKLTQDELANQSAKNDQLEGLLQPVIAEQDPVKQQALWEQTKSAAISKGLMTAEEAAQHPYPGPDGVKSYAMGLETEKWLTAQGAQQRGAAAGQQAATSAGKEKREAGQQEFQGAISALAASPPANGQEYQQRVGALPYSVAQRIFTAVPPAQYDPQRSVQTLRQLGMTPEQQTQAQAAAVPKTETELAAIAADPTKPKQDRDNANAALKRLDQSKIAARPVIQTIVPGLGPNAQNPNGAQLHGDDYLKSLPPATAAQVRAIGEGKDVMPPASSRSQAAVQIRAAVYQYDPEFDVANSNNRFQTLREFNNSTVTHAGGQVLALNTLIHHADLYMETADALKNGTFKPGNAVYNAVADAFGKAPPTQANLVARFFAGETGKVATGGVPAEGEINGLLSSLGNNASPDQIKGAGSTLLQIAGGRMIPLKEKADQAKLGNVVHVLGPDAQDILQRRGFDPNTMKPVSKGGGAGGAHVIKIGNKQYQYNGSGDTSKLENYTEVKP